MSSRTAIRWPTIQFRHGITAACASAPSAPRRRSQRRRPRREAGRIGSTSRHAQSAIRRHRFRKRRSFTAANARCRKWHALRRRPAKLPARAKRHALKPGLSRNRQSAISAGHHRTTRNCGGEGATPRSAERTEQSPAGWRRSTYPGTRKLVRWRHDRYQCPARNSHRHPP